MQEPQERIKLRDAAWINLLFIARVDGELDTSEASLLRNYQEALGISDQESRSLSRRAKGPLDSSQITANHDECAQLIEMMSRVAWADDALSSKEEHVLSELAETLGIGELEYANIKVKARSHATTSGRIRRTKIYAALALVLLAFAILALGIYLGSDIKRNEEAGRAAFEELQSDVEEAGLQGTQRVEALESANQERLDDMENEIRRRIRDVETAASVTSTSPRRGFVTPLPLGDLDELRVALAEIQGARENFKRFARNYNDSVLLLYTSVTLKKGSRIWQRWGSGTGFVLTPEGHVITNKHVAKPWLFDGKIRRHLDEGWRINESSLRIWAWPAGSLVKIKSGSLNSKTAWTTDEKELRIAKTTIDRFEDRSARVRGEKRYFGSYHVLDISDLALLKINHSEPLPTIPVLGAIKQVEQLDPIMLLGYPGSLSVRESTIANTAPTLGEVRKIEKSIFISAPILPGNSGGPLINSSGHAIGVAYKDFGAETAGGVIPIQHALRLLPTASRLLQFAEQRAAKEEMRAALDLIDLAMQRDPKDVTRHAAKTLKNQLIARRDHAMAEARERQGRGDFAGANREFDAIIANYGPRWAAAAAKQKKF